MRPAKVLPGTTARSRPEGVSAVGPLEAVDAALGDGDGRGIDAVEDGDGVVALIGGGFFARVVFHEITERAVRAALAAPRGIDGARVDAQEARRVVDRLAGYTMSPLLWRRVSPRLSAGRVQSAALALAVGRERERIAFKRAPYHRVLARWMRKGLYGALAAAIERGVPMIAPCNGFQIAVQAGLLPGPGDGGAAP